MTFEDCLYWTLLESDLHNAELYLPADTPVGKVNPKRLLKILRTRHQRQEQRLIQQQVYELNEYQHDFSQQNKEDFFIKGKISCCELIKGSDYLQQESDQMNAFLAQIPSLVGHPSDDSIQAIPMPDKYEQDLLHILKKKYKGGFEILNDTHALKYDALLELQKQDLSVIPKDVIDPLLSPVPQQPKTKLMQDTLEKLNDLKHRSDQQDKIERINKTMNQVQELRDQITFTSSKLPFKARPFSSSKKVYPPIPSKGPPRVTTASKSSNVPPVIATSSKKPYKGPPLVNIASTAPLTTSSTSSKASSTTSLIPSSNTSASTQTKRTKPSRFDIGPSISTDPTNQAEEIPITPYKTNMLSKKKQSLFIAPYPRTNIKMPKVFDSLSQPQPLLSKQRGKTFQTSLCSRKIATGVPAIGSTASQSISTPTNANSLVGIPIGAGPPKVASSSSKKKKERSEPLLLRSKFEPLMEKGELRIKNNSVQIRFPHSIEKYGDPRDYDDAISNTAKSGNPVTRRQYQGRDYLFFRSETQQVVPVGLVSKIQPLIHKYFLDQQSSIADL